MRHHPVPKAVKLDTDVISRLEHLGKLKKRTSHWLMKEAISRYLEQEEYAEQLKQETLARWKEVQQGKVVSNKTVMTWLDTWGTDEETGRPPCGS